MPQGDFVSFPSTVMALAVAFGGGYTFFVSWCVPKIILAVKVRHWLSSGATYGLNKDSYTTATSSTSFGSTKFDRFLHSIIFGLVWITEEPKSGEQQEEDDGWLLDILFGHLSWLCEQLNLVALPEHLLSWFIITERYYTFDLVDYIKNAGWPETLLLFLLSVGLALVLESIFPDLAVNLGLLSPERKAQLLPSLEWIYPASVLLSLWFTYRENVLHRLYSQVSDFTSSIVQNIFLSLPVASTAMVYQRLKIVQLELNSEL